MKVDAVWGLGFQRLVLYLWKLGRGSELTLYLNNNEGVKDSPYFISYSSKWEYDLYQLSSLSINYFFPSFHTFQMSIHVFPNICHLLNIFSNQ